MLRVDVLRSLTPELRHTIGQFLDQAHRTSGETLGDHLLADLIHGPRPGFVAALAFDAHGSPVGFAQASTGNDGVVVDCVVVDGSVRITLLSTVIGELPASATVTWWSHDIDGADAVAEAIGLRPGRRLLQLRVPLPLAPEVLARSADVPVRRFVVGSDEQQWLLVNNAAFAWHGEQGGWDLATLRQREREPWFDADGFLLHDRDGRLAAFCWTKWHPATSPDAGPDAGPEGEIYVIAVHPDFHGLGLGRALTVAGLRYVHERGAGTGMLYVDADNTSAVHLYETLGFRRDRSDQAYVRTPEGTAS